MATAEEIYKTGVDLLSVVEAWLEKARDIENNLPDVETWDSTANVIDSVQAFISQQLEGFSITSQNEICHLSAVLYTVSFLYYSGALKIQLDHTDYKNAQAVSQLFEDLSQLI